MWPNRQKKKNNNDNPQMLEKIAYKENYRGSAKASSIVEHALRVGYFLEKHLSYSLLRQERDAESSSPVRL